MAERAGRKHEHAVVLCWRMHEQVALGAAERPGYLITHVEEIGIIGGLRHVVSSRAHGAGQGKDSLGG